MVWNPINTWEFIYYSYRQLELNGETEVITHYLDYTHYCRCPISFSSLYLIFKDATSLVQEYHFLSLKCRELVPSSTQDPFPRISRKTRKVWQRTSPT